MDQRPLLHETKLRAFLFDFFKAVRNEVSKAPLIQHIEIAGIDTPVSLDDVLPPTDSLHIAGFRWTADQNQQQIFKISIIDLLSRRGILIPAVKQVLEVLFEFFRRQ